MGRTNSRFNAAQQLKLDELRTAHHAKVVARATMKAEIEKAFEAKQKDFEFTESRLMNEAKNMGISKTAISRAVGISNWQLLQEKYALTADLVALKPGRDPIIVTRISLQTKPINSVGPQERQMPLWGTYIVRDFDYNDRVWELELKGGFHLDGTASFPSEVIGEQEEVDLFMSILNVSGGKIYDRELQAYLTNLTADYKG